MKTLIKLITIIQAFVISYYILNFQFSVLENLLNFTYPAILNLLLTCSMLWMVLIIDWLLTVDILVR